MKFKGGPFDGKDNGTEVDLQVGEHVFAPGRVQINGRWYSATHVYEIAGPEEAHYVISQYEHKN